jgi:hypothetical protein
MVVAADLGSMSTSRRFWRWPVPRKLFEAIVLAVTLGACGQGAGPAASTAAKPSAAVTAAPTSTLTVTPSPTPASAVKELKAAAVLTWMSPDAASLRMRPDGQADLWVRFTNTTKSAYGFVDMTAALFSASGPVGEQVAISSVNPQGSTPAGARGWLNATLPMTAVDFAATNSVGLAEVVPPIPNAFGKPSYAATNLTAVRQADGSITVSGTLDGELTGLAAYGGLGAFLEFVVLDPSGAPLGEFDTSVKPSVEGSTRFDHVPFSANSASHLPSLPPGPVMPPGDIGAVEVFGFP